eukprot:tig00021428_g21149.t1
MQATATARSGLSATGPRPAKFTPRLDSGPLSPRPFDPRWLALRAADVDAAMEKLQAARERRLAGGDDASRPATARPATAGPGGAEAEARPGTADAGGRGGGGAGRAGAPGDGGAAARPGTSAGRSVPVSRESGGESLPHPFVPTFRSTGRTLQSKGLLGFVTERRDKAGREPRWPKPAEPFTVERIEATLRQKMSEKPQGGSHQLKKAFAWLDKDASGAISYEELRRGLEQFNIPISDAELRQLVARYDANGDGQIDLYEFVRRVMPQDYGAGPGNVGLVGHLGKSPFEWNKKHQVEEDRPVTPERWFLFNGDQRRAYYERFARRFPRGMEALSVREIEQTLQDKFRTRLRGPRGTVGGTMFFRQYMKHALGRRRGGSSRTWRARRSPAARLPLTPAPLAQTYGELFALLRDANLPVSRPQFEALARRYDPRGSGRVDIERLASFIVAPDFYHDPRTGAYRGFLHEVLDEGAKVTHSEPQSYRLPFSVRNIESLLQNKIKQRCKGGAFYLLTAFNHFNKGREGAISYERFREELRNFNIDLAPDELAALIRKYDEDLSGTIDMTEFIQHVMPEDYPLDPEASPWKPRSAAQPLEAGPPRSEAAAAYTSYQHLRAPPHGRRHSDWGEEEILRAVAAHVDSGAPVLPSPLQATPPRTPGPAPRPAAPAAPLTPRPRRRPRRRGEPAAAGDADAGRGGADVAAAAGDAERAALLAARAAAAERAAAGDFAASAHAARGVPPPPWTGARGRPWTEGPGRAPRRHRWRPAAPHRRQRRRPAALRERSPPRPILDAGRRHGAVAPPPDRKRARGVCTAPFREMSGVLVIRT